MKDFFVLRKIFLLGFFLLLWNGCKKDSTTQVDQSESVPYNVFPLTAGHQFTFGGYLTEGSTETPIGGTEINFSASWTVTPNTPLTNVFSSAVVSHLTKTSASLIIDSMNVSGALAKPKVTPVFVYYDSTANEYHYLTNFGYVFRSNFFYDSVGGKIRKDSLRFITLAVPKTGTGKEFFVFEENFNSYRFSPSTAVNINIKVTGNFEKKENLTLNVNGKDTTFSTYYLVIKNTATVPGFTPVTSVTAKFWLVEGIGPVQMFLAGDTEAPGSFRRLKSKNF